MQMSQEVSQLVEEAVRLASGNGCDYVFPEHCLYMLTFDFLFGRAFRYCGGNVDVLREKLGKFLDEYGNNPRCTGAVPTDGLRQMLSDAQEQALKDELAEVDIIHLVDAMYRLPENFGVYFMQSQGVEAAELLEQMSMLYYPDQPYVSFDWSDPEYTEPDMDEYWEEMEDAMLEEEEPEAGAEDETAKNRQKDRKKQPGWQRYAPCMNDQAAQMAPLIGREEELERTMQVLCRKEKNNPLHIGEPGVGKTAIAWGLARLLNENQVPKALEGGRMFALDLGGMIAGTQYRGDFEKRFQEIMSGIEAEEKPIVYIDEIHMIVGAGAVSDGSMDVSNLLKPYLARGHIRFIGATTYTEYKKHFEKNRSLVRRFQNITVKEPDAEDTVRILEGLKPDYERYHGVIYEDGVLRYAVESSIRYINERFLPDKAIDLMDEAGAYRQMHPQKQETQVVDRALVDQILTSICQVPPELPETDETDRLATLEQRIGGQVFGQQEAVAQVVNAVKFSRAGLLEETAPEASLLFVGPTGVGKTEVARTLAKELGVPLVRFDMSEYGEKHTVAKLIGAPAGYVGYEEGGLLTEAIRKNPYCVLLLDEIEKAHGDIYNVLLQVMDYATLTDNQGRKADFRHVILIMTSNAGADRLLKEQIGFGRTDTRPDVMMDAVKRTFQPEFRNRLNRIVMFRALDDAMADRITRKKLDELAQKLKARQVAFSYTDQAAARIRQEGISQEYGARQIQRVIDSQVKPLLADALLFGVLKTGGVCRLELTEDRLDVIFHPHDE